MLKESQKIGITFSAFVRVDSIDERKMGLISAVRLVLPFPKNFFWVLLPFMFILS